MNAPFTDIDDVSGTCGFPFCDYFRLLLVLASFDLIYDIVEDYDIETPPGVLLNTDAKTLEKMSERSYVRDWVRLKLVPEAGANSNKSKETFRLTQINGAYMMCRR